MSFVQNAVFYDFMTAFNKYLMNQLKDFTSLVLILDGQVSYITIDWLRSAMENKADFVQLPSHPSHVTPWLDVCAFGIHKLSFTDKLLRYPAWNGGRIPVEIDIAGVMRDVLVQSFTLHNIRAFSAGVDFAPLDRGIVINRLNFRGTKRKVRPFDHTPLADIPLLTNGEQPSMSWGSEPKAVSNEGCITTAVCQHGLRHIPQPR